MKKKYCFGFLTRHLLSKNLSNSPVKPTPTTGSTNDQSTNNRLELFNETQVLRAGVYDDITYGDALSLGGNDAPSDGKHLFDSNHDGQSSDSNDSDNYQNSKTDASYQP